MLLILNGIEIYLGGRRKIAKESKPDRAILPPVTVTCGKVPVTPAAEKQIAWQGVL